MLSTEPCGPPDLIEVQRRRENPPCKTTFCFRFFQVVSK